MSYGLRAISLQREVRGVLLYDPNGLYKIVGQAPRLALMN